MLTAVEGTVGDFKAYALAGVSFEVLLLPGPGRHTMVCTASATSGSVQVGSALLGHGQEAARQLWLQRGSPGRASAPVRRNPSELGAP